MENDAYREPDVHVPFGVSVSAEVIAQGSASEQFHGQVEDTFGSGAHVMHGDDVFVAQSPGELGFFNKEILAALGSQGSGAHKLERDFFVDESIERPIDGTHAALTDGLINDVAVADDGAGFEIDGEIGLVIGLVGNLERCSTAETGAFSARYGGGDLYFQAAAGASDINHWGGNRVGFVVTRELERNDSTV